MKKNITIVVLILITMFSLVYGFIQQAKTKAAWKQAEMNLEVAFEAEKKAAANATESNRLQKIAMEQKAIAQAELEKCRDRK